MQNTKGIQISILFFTFIHYIFGKHWNLLLILLFLNVLDTVLGTLKARKTKTENSIIGFRGLKKKIYQWILLLLSFIMSFCFKELGAILGINLSISPLFGWYVYTYFIFNEYQSIIENLIQLGVSIPKILINGLEMAKESVERKDRERINGE
ncbi:phage holin family protein [Absicoccus porci]|uniref:phage holin family protein n=1 Tax=Absicoccus porci TaxID=2486576 RepID=UPI003F8AE1DB